MSILQRHPTLTLVRGALLVAALTAVALGLAYQVRSRVIVDVGSAYDAPWVARFFDAEDDGTQTYRWTRGQSRIELDAQALAAPWTARIRVNGYRPGQPPQVQVLMNDTPVGSFEAEDGWKVYHLEGNVPADWWSGNNILTFINDTFVPQQVIRGSKDTRKLGVATDFVELTPARSAAALGSDDAWIDFGRPPSMPPPGAVGSWALALGLLYATGRGIGLPKRALAVVFALAILLLAGAIAFERPFAGYYATPLLILAICLTGLAVASWLLVPRFAAHLHLVVGGKERSALVAIVLVGVGLKWGGVWYPQFRSSDLLFHAHRLEFAAQGKLFFTSELPDAAHRVVPYPPALYIALTPFTPWVHDYAGLLLWLNPVADVLALLAFYFAARQIDRRRATGDTLPVEEPLKSPTRFALWATLLFAFYPVAFLIYSWGNHTNIFAQDAATVCFALALTGSMARPRNFLLALLSFLLAATGHLGVFLSLLAFLPLAALVRLTGQDPEAKREGRAFLALLGIALGSAVLVYYGEFAGPLLTQTQTFLVDFGTGRAAGRGGITLARIGDVAHYTTDQLGVILLLIGAAGIPLAWTQFAARARSVWIAWLGVGVLFALVTLGSTFSTRYTLWAAPALALSGGLVLAWIDQRVRPLSYAPYMLGALAVGQTVWFWLDQVWNGYH